ncbi:MAG: hypothetical protein WBP13_06140 [Methylophilaceae bacterium]
MIGTASPTPDASLTILSINLASGQVALVNKVVPLGSVSPVSVLSIIVDLVGYGTVPALPPINTKSAVRAGYGCNETDSNLNDFSISSLIIARNSAS